MKCRKQAYLAERYPKQYFVLKELPSLIRRGTRLRVENLPENDLWKYYHLYTIRSLAKQIPLPSRTVLAISRQSNNTIIPMMPNWTMQTDSSAPSSAARFTAPRQLWHL